MHTSTSQLGLVPVRLIKQSLVLRQQPVEEVAPSTSTELKNEKKEKQGQRRTNRRPTRNSGTRRAKSYFF